MKDYLMTINVDDKEYTLVFNLNVMEAIQAEYGTIDEWGARTESGAPLEPKVYIKNKNGSKELKRTGECDIKALIFGITEMINEGMDIRAEETGEPFKPFSKKQVARIITSYGIGEAREEMQKAIIEATKSDEKNA